MAKTHQITEDQTDEPRAGDVGALLHGTRERAGLTLRDVADALRIRMAHLEAIEGGDYGSLPGATYAVGFVRAYADHLGLDSSEIVRRFKAESAIQPSRNDLDMPVPVSDGGLPSGAAIAVGLVVIGAIYGAWYFASSDDRPMAEIVQEVPDRFMALLRSTPDSDAALDEAPAADAQDAGQTVDLSAEKPAAEVAPTGTDVSPEPAPAETAPVEPALPDASAPAPEPVADAPAEAPPAPEPAPVSEPEPAPAAAVEAAPQSDGTEVPSAPPVEAAQPMVSEAEPVPEPAPAVEVQPEAPVAPVVERAEPEVVQASASAEAPEAPPAVPEAPPAPAAAETAPVPPPVASIPEGGRVYGEENADARVILRARADSWVQVRDNEGLLLTRLLRAGDSYQVPLREGLRLMTGNAGGLLIEVDGTLLPPLGGTGEVRRNIPLDAASLQSSGAGPN